MFDRKGGDPYRHLRGDDNETIARLSKIGYDPYLRGVEGYENSQAVAFRAGISEIALEKLRVECQMYADEELDKTFGDFRETVERDRVLQAMRHNFRGYFWSRRVAQKRIEHPKTWLDAFKIRFFPKRLLQRFPAAYQVYDMDFRAVYPTLRVAGHEAHPHLIFAEISRQNQPMFFNIPSADDVTLRLNPNTDIPGDRFNDPDYFWTKGDGES